MYMRLTKEECLELGVKYIKTHNCYPAAKRWTTAAAGCSRDRIYENWGSWDFFISELKVLVDVPEIKQEYRCKWDRELCIGSIRKSAKNNKGWPRYKDFSNSNDYPSLLTIKKYLGSWDNAIVEAGFTNEPAAETDLSIDLYEALILQFDKYGYTIPKNTKNINKETLLRFISSRESTQQGALGYSTGGWVKFIKKVFPDKSRNTNYYDWLLLKDDLKFCPRCERVKSVVNFWRNSNNYSKYNNDCIECLSKELVKTAKHRTSKYRASKLKACPKWADIEAIKQFYYNCPEGYHVDHIIPLQGKYVCGLHVENNLQYLLATENSIKRNYHESEECWK